MPDDPSIGWEEDPYVSAQTVPQDTSATGANDPGVWDTGQTINPNSFWGQNLPGWLGGSFTPAAGSSLQGALSTLAKSSAGQGAGAAGEKMSPMNLGNAPGVQGAGASRGSSETLGQLLAALDARRNLLLQSATSGQARPVANPANPAAGGATRQTTGLLGI